MLVAIQRVSNPETGFEDVAEGDRDATAAAETVSCVNCGERGGPESSRNPSKGSFSRKSSNHLRDSERRGNTLIARILINPDPAAGSPPGVSDPRKSGRFVPPRLLVFSSRVASRERHRFSATLSSLATILGSLRSPVRPRVPYSPWSFVVSRRVNS